MFEIRLIHILASLALFVAGGLILDYLQILRRPVRLGFWLAIAGIIAGFYLTLQAVLPGDRFYGPVFTEVQTSQKIVALTFDDGPYPPYTGQILDILKENKIHATFFVIGKNAEKYPELVRRAAAEGHQIGNHTYDHIDLLKADSSKVAAEVDRTNAIILSITGQTPQVIRPPHGFRDAVVMNVLAERGLKVIDWSVMSRDWTKPGADLIVNRTMSQVKNGSIILLHDGDGVAQADSRAQTVEATRRIIHELRQQGYKFVTVNELLQQTGGQEATSGHG